MKQLITILILFLSFAQFSNAQGNFGKRKFSRSLFAKNVRIKPANVAKKEITLEQESETKIFQSDSIQETISVDSLPLLGFSISELSQDSLSFNSDMISETENVEFDLNEEEKSSNIKLQMVEKKLISNARIELNTEKLINRKNQVGLSDNFHDESLGIKTVWDDIVDVLIYIGILLLIAALIVGFMLLYNFFPIFATVLGVIAAVVGFFVLLFLAFSALVDGFFSIFER